MKFSSTLILWCVLFPLSSVAAGSLRGQQRELQTCQLPWNGQNIDVGVNGFDATQVINTSCANGDVTISLDLSHTGKLETSGNARDFLQVLYKVDNGPTLELLDIVGEQYSSSNQVTVAAGASLSIQVVGDTSFINEVYQIRNFVVTGSGPTPTPPAPTPPPACALPWTGPNYNVGNNGLDVTTASINTSCVGDVTISLTLTHLGGMETSGFAKDTLQVSYKIDNTPETLWLDIAGDQYSTSNQVTVASGASLSIRVQGDTTAGDEVYQIRNLIVSESAASPTPPPPTPPVPTPPPPTLPPPTTPGPTPSPTPPSPTPPSPTPATCAIPQFVGNWISGNPNYPLNVGESQGAMINNDLLIVSGFTGNWDAVTKQVYKLDTTNPNANWVQLDDVKYPDGVSHAGFVTNGQKFYMCGVYLGPNPGPNNGECYVFDHQASAGNQWTALPSLPDGGRGGGGLVFIHEANSLVYAGGATRSGWNVNDKTEAWILDLSNLNTGWSATTNIPFAANHLSAVTAKDGSGAWRTYFMGGQVKGDEGSSENSDLYEFVYNPNGADQWVKRADMPITRGHASSSTRPYGCGFIIAGGTTNGGGMTSDISYYDPLDGPNGKWTKIGDLPQAINTPVCDYSLNVNGEDWMYCETGSPYGSFSHRRKISVA